jgi:hypothetical protein
MKRGCLKSKGSDHTTRRIFFVAHVRSDPYETASFYALSFINETQYRRAFYVGKLFSEYEFQEHRFYTMLLYSRQKRWPAA